MAVKYIFTNVYNIDAQNAMVIAQQHGVNALRDNPDSMGTSLDMLRRAANTLTNLSRHKDNIPLLARQEQRLLSLVMSQILDQGVASILSNVLFNIGAHPSASGTSAVSKPFLPCSSLDALPPLQPQQPAAVAVVELDAVAEAEAEETVVKAEAVEVKAEDDVTVVAAPAVLDALDPLTDDVKEEIKDNSDDDK